MQNNKYFDRKMMKYAPFDALTSQTSEIQQMKHSKYKSPRPILSEDQYEELNYKILDILSNNNIVDLEYYKDGYIYIIYNITVKLDINNRNIITSNNTKIKLEDIININY